MQRVAEFVEQRTGVVEGKQRRLALAGLGEVHDVDRQAAGYRRASFSWSRKLVIQAPLCFDARAK